VKSFIQCKPRLLRRGQSRWGFQRGEAAVHPFGRTRGFKPRVRYNLISDKRAFTTAELLLAALFGMIVMGTLYSFYRAQMFNLLAQETKTATREDVRGALDIMVRELSNAGSFPFPEGYPTIRPAGDDTGSGCKRVVSADANSIRVQMDLSSSADGDCTDRFEDITYSYDPIKKTIGRRAPTRKFTVVNNVVIPPGKNFLTFYTSGSTTAITPDPTTINAIKKVMITFSVQAPNPSPNGRAAGIPISSTLVSSVEFRN